MDHHWKITSQGGNGSKLFLVSKEIEIKVIWVRRLVDCWKSFCDPGVPWFAWASKMMTYAPSCAKTMTPSGSGKWIVFVAWSQCAKTCMLLVSEKRQHAQLFQNIEIKSKISYLSLITAIKKKNNPNIACWIGLWLHKVKRISASDFWHAVYYMKKLFKNYLLSGSKLLVLFFLPFTSARFNVD